MIRRPPRSTLFPTRRSSDLGELRDHGPRHHATCPRRSDADTGSVPPSSGEAVREPSRAALDRKSTRLNSSHSQISYAVFCLKKKKNNIRGHILFCDHQLTIP